MQHLRHCAACLWKEHHTRLLTSVFMSQYTCVTDIRQTTDDALWQLPNAVLQQSTKMSWNVRLVHFIITIITRSFVEIVAINWINAKVCKLCVPEFILLLTNILMQVRSLYWQNSSLLHSIFASLLLESLVYKVIVTHRSRMGRKFIWE